MKKKLLTILCLLIFGFGQSQTSLLNEDFSFGVPFGWNTNNFGTCVDGFVIDNTFSYPAPLNSLIQGNFMVAESYQNSAACNANTDLISPDMNGMGYTSVDMYFDIDFNPYTTGSDELRLYIWDGFNWNLTWQIDYATSGSFYEDLTPYAANNPYLAFKFEYAGFDGLYVALDNIEVLGFSGLAPSWDCDGQGQCYDPGTGFGQYQSLTACQSMCIAPSWDCDGMGTCYDPGNGTGIFSSIAACQNSCIAPSWDCAGGTTCYDPGTGFGQYGSLAACQSMCIIPSWNCDGMGTCYDPGNGTGLYSSIAACQSNCVSSVALIDEDFTFGFPTNWSVTNFGNCIDGWVLDYEPTYPIALNPVIQGNFMVAESYDLATNTACVANAEMVSPSVDASMYTSVWLYFDMDFNPGITGYDTISFFVYDGFNWILIDETDLANSGSFGYDISQYAINNPFLTVGFWYHGNNGQQCAIDNILVEGSMSTNPVTWNCISPGNCQDPGNGSGMYSSLAACNSACTTTPASWDCDGMGICYDPGTGMGNYQTQSQCQANCIAPSWNCDAMPGGSTCYDPQDGTGTYTSLADCQINCISPSWNCDLSGNCTDPGDGSGTYMDESMCLMVCIATPSWDCDGMGNCSDPGTGMGIYTSLSDCQTNCITPSWDCTIGGCVDPGTGNGQYATLTPCLTACGIAPSWNCDGMGNCTDPGTGMGVYPSLTDCQTNCTIPASWNCDAMGNCTDPGDGSGTYATINLCNIVCTAPTTWDCDGQGNCSDPGTGFGTFSSLSDCQAICKAPSWDCVLGVSCFDPGTGTGQYNDLNLCLTSCGVVDSWDCMTDNICVQSGTGLGMYPSLNDCIQFSNCITTIDEEVSEISIYPNPARNTLIIEGDYLSATIYDIYGKIVLTTDDQRKTIDVTILNSGVYFVHLNTNYAISVKKITIAK